MKRLFLFLSLSLLWAVGLQADVKFDDWFDGRTLRADYIFAGDSAQAELSLAELIVEPRWYGRRVNLDRLFFDGTGQITMTDELTGLVLYRHAFSSLFQEWQGTAEATHVRKAFENTFLMPMPKQPAVVTVRLLDFRGNTAALMKHRIDPQDILIRQMGHEPTTPWQYVWQGSVPHPIDIAIVAEGYTEAQMDTFLADARTAADALFKAEPFAGMKERFNIVAVCVPSAQSGVSVPRQNLWRSTALSSHFDTFYSNRYLTTLHLKRLHDVLAGIPYEHIIILANTPTYGGGGILNSYTLVAAHDKSFQPVVVHEFGHSFGGLADEYYYDDEYSPRYVRGIEPYEPNITTLTHFETKWQDLLPKGTIIPTPQTNKGRDVYTKIGVYEGGGYQSKGVYRAFQDCRMKTNEAPDFCAVCQRALERLIRFYTEPQD